MTITDAALSIIVLGMLLLALGVDLAGALRLAAAMAYACASTACGGTMAPRLALVQADRLARHWNAVQVQGADDAIRDGSAKIASDLIASARKPSTAIEGDADEVI